MVEVKRILNWNQAAQFQKVWNDIVLENNNLSTPTVFQTYEWNRTWWQSFNKENYELLLLFAFENSSLVGIAPLMIIHHKSWFSKKIIYFIGTSDTLLSSDYCSLIVSGQRKDVYQALFEWLYFHPKCWDQLELYHLSDDSMDLKMLQERFRKRSNLRCEGEAPFRTLNIDNDNLIDNSRHTKRKIKQLKQIGRLEFEHRETPEDIFPLLNKFFDLHVLRRSGTAYPSYFNDKNYRNYYRKITHAMAPKNWVKLLVLTLNKELIAGLFCFEFKNKLYAYTIVFDLKYRKYSPGIILQIKILEFALNRDIKEFSFGAGDEKFKYQLSNNVTKLYTFRAFQTLIDFVAYKTELICRHLWRIFKSFQKIYMFRSR